MISGSGSKGSANLEFPLIPKGKFGELVTKNNEYDGAKDIEAFVADFGVDIWRAVEIAPDKMTTAESAEDKALNEATAERVATEAIVQMVTIKNLIVEKMADRAVQVSNTEFEAVEDTIEPVEYMVNLLMRLL